MHVLGSIGMYWDSLGCIYYLYFWALGVNTWFNKRYWDWDNSLGYIYILVILLPLKLLFL